MLPVPYMVRRIWIVFLICPSLIICIRGACSVPERLPYAVPIDVDLNQDIFLPGITVRYKCRLGFIRAPLSSNVITCRDDFTWSTPTREFCTRRSCGYPEEMENGEFEATNGFLFGSKLTYKCNVGYQMESRRDYRDCQEDGSWSNDVPQCGAVICSAPGSPAGGTYSPVKYEYHYQEAVTFFCSRGLHVIGASSASCTSDGRWSARTPNCTAACTLPPKLDFAVLEDEYTHQTYFDHGRFVEYKCRPGFVPVTGKNNKLTCLKDLKWSQHEIFCTPILCGDPGAIDHGQMHSENFFFGSRVNYTCNSGYLMISKRNYRDCQADGTWSGKPPVCREPVCDRIWEVQEEVQKCTSTPDEWIKYLQVQYLYLQIENIKLDVEIKKKLNGLV